MTGAEPITTNIHGAMLTLDISGAAWWAAERTLIVADVHFEKGSALAAQGHRLPAYDTAANLGLLEKLIAQYQPKRLVALGDSFHDRAAGKRIPVAEQQRLNALADKTALIWILGNHDPALPAWLRGEQTAELALGPLVFRHEPQDAPVAGELAGHLHPCARIRGRGLNRPGRSFRRRAFLEDGTRMVLPSFGAFTGGLNALDDAYAPVFPGPFNAWLIGRDIIARAPSTGLIEDRKRLADFA
ncbi:MAG: ligase-associated DNA damage response endonuclease PdeM [Alphaproteobacteria bacterium]